jgi:hypothetical protein
MRHPIEHAHASLKANIWLLTKPTATSNPDGGNHPDRENNKGKNKNAAKRKKHHGRAGRLACANTGGCAGISEQPEKQKQTTA